jgi:undecaprenyl-diphosphatase
VFSRSRSAVSRFDDRVDACFDHLRGHPVPDRIFYAASELGDFGLLWLLLASARSLRSERDEKAAVRVAVCSVVESGLVNGVVKSFFRRKRPVFDAVRPHHLRTPLTSSFPSGHATAAACNTILLSEDDPLWPLYVALAAVVATSRVYVKIHHASDVLAGLALGSLFGLTAKRLWPLPTPKG